MPDEIVDYRLANAEERHLESPRSFFIPPRSERESLKPGELAKLLFELVEPGEGMPGGERMWVEVTGVEHGSFAGVLTNQPRTITTIQAGDQLRFGPEHVIQTIENWPLLEKKILVSRRSHTADQQPRWVYRETPDNENDSGWRALVGDETDAELEDSANILLQNLGFFLDRWPELRPVFKTDPENSSWIWHESSGQYEKEKPNH